MSINPGKEIWSQVIYCINWPLIPYSHKVWCVLYLPPCPVSCLHDYPVFLSLFYIFQSDPSPKCPFLYAVEIIKSLCGMPSWYSLSLHYITQDKATYNITFLLCPCPMWILEWLLCIWLTMWKVCAKSCLINWRYNLSDSAFTDTNQRLASMLCAGRAS